MPIARKQKSAETKVETNKPVAEFSYRLTKASIWENVSADGKVHHSVTFGRSYRTNDGWRKSKSFGVFDLDDIQKVTDKHATGYLHSTKLRQFSPPNKPPCP